MSRRAVLALVVGLSLAALLPILMILTAVGVLYLYYSQAVERLAR